MTQRAETINSNIKKSKHGSNKYKIQIPSAKKSYLIIHLKLCREEQSFFITDRVPAYYVLISNRVFDIIRLASVQLKIIVSSSGAMQMYSSKLSIKDG